MTNKINEKLNSIVETETYEALVDSMAGIMISSLLIQFIIFIFSVITSKVLLPLQLFGLMIPFLSFILLKESAKESHKTIGRGVIKVSPLLFLLSVSFVGLRSFTASVGSNRVSLTPFVVMFSVSIIVLYFVLMNNENVKRTYKEIEEITFISTDDDLEYSPGDMIIGKRFNISYLEDGDKEFEETDEDVILPVTDRYLHMLIIGPTGSGKTSQVLIPQINRDIQVKELGMIVLEPKGDLAEQVYAMGEYYGRDDVEYFNPTHPDCPYFNPLAGPEDEVIENITTTFKTLADSANPYFENQGEMLIRRALSVLKRMEKDPKAREYLHGDEATLIDLSVLIHNNEAKGRRMVTAFSKIPVQSDELQKDNDDIAAWFLSDYFTGSNAADTRSATKTYEHTSDMRNQIAKLVSNVHLRRVLNPPKGYSNEIDFAKTLEEGNVLALTTNQGTLRDLGRFLGYFLILQLQSDVLDRPGNEDTRRGCMLFIDEFQVYANDGFEDMLTQGRSYRVACHLATQAIDQIDTQGSRFLAVVKANCRNLIAFPDIDPEDAKWFSLNFGEVMVSQVMTGYSQQKIGFGNIGRFRPVNESERMMKSLEPRLTPSDIMSREFGEISYKIMNNNNVATPGVAKIEYIPWELKTTLDDIVDSYNERLDESNQREKYSHSNADEESLVPVYDDEPVTEPVVEEEPEEPSVDYTDILSSTSVEPEAPSSEDLIGVGKPIEKGNFVQDDGAIEEEF